MGSVFGKTDAKEPSFEKLKAEPYEVRVYGPSVIAEVDCGESSNQAFNTLAKFIGVMGQPENIKAVEVPGTTEPTKTAASEKISMTAPVLTHKNVMQFVLPPQYERPEQVPTPTNPAVTVKAAPQRTVAVYKFSGTCTLDQCHKKLKKLHKMLVADKLLEGPAAKPLEPDSESSASSAENGGEEAQAPALVPAQEPAQEPAQQPTPQPAAGQEPTAPVAGEKGPAKEGGAEESAFAAGLTWLVAQYHPPWTIPFLRRNEIWVELRPESPAVAALVQQHQAAVELATRDAQAAGEKGEGKGPSLGEDVLGDVQQAGAGGAKGPAGAGDADLYTPRLEVQQPAADVEAPAAAGAGAGSSADAGAGSVDTTAQAKEKGEQHVGFTTPPAGPEAEASEGK